MAITNFKYTGDGILKNFSVTGALSQSHVRVWVDDDQKESGWTLSSSTILFDSPPSNGAEINIYVSSDGSFGIEYTAPNAITNVSDFLEYIQIVAENISYIQDNIEDISVWGPDYRYALLSGSTFTGDLNFGDNIRAKFGDGNDLQIVHNGTNGYIQNVGNGYLNIKSDTLVLSSSGSPADLYFVGGTSGSYMYHKGDTKLETTATGVTVSGTITADSFSGIDLTQLDDVSDSMTPTDGQVLTYDTTNGWQAEEQSTYTDSDANEFDIGVDQTWVSGASLGRVANVAYQNTTGKPIFVSWSLEDNQVVDISSDGIYWTQMISWSSDRGPNSLIIPNNWYYKALGTSYWMELR